MRAVTPASTPSAARENIEAISSDEPTIAGSSVEFVHVARVSPEFFQVLSIAPVLGRLLTAEDEQADDSGRVN
jgi:hypothetical protein